MVEATDDAVPEETGADESTPQAAPMLRVVSPDATPEEVAALVAVFAALGSGEDAPASPPREWNAPHRMVRRAVAPGRGGWRSSGLPLR